MGLFWPKNLLPFLRSTCVNSAVFSEMDNLIEARELQIERKHFHVEFRENDRGKFLRITEEAHGRRNTIIVPSTGVEEFTAAIEQVIEEAERAPA
jgi:PurA ssDNA and RNA-binding protein